VHYFAVLNNCRRDILGTEIFFCSNPNFLLTKLYRLKYNYEKEQRCCGFMPTALFLYRQYGMLRLAIAEQYHMGTKACIY